MASPEKPPPVIIIQPVSPRFPKSSSLTAGNQRKVAIAVDLSDESAYAVNWAVQNYLRRDDTVILLHVRPTSVLYGADWGVVDVEASDTVTDEESQQKLEDDFDAFTTTKANDLAKPLVESQINFKIHIVKDHDMKERLCLEVERLGLSAVIMGSRGFGASRRISKGQRLGSVSDYCVHHCVCPVVVVRFPGDKDGENAVGSPLRVSDKNGGSDGLRQPVSEEEPEFHVASDKQTGPIRVANPARDLVAERNAETARDRQQAAARANRFAARRMTTAAPPRRNEALETVIYTTAVNYPFTAVIYPSVSTFTPNASTLMFYLNYMDQLMASSKQWTDNCMGWVPPLSQTYISILFYLQTMRAMDAAGSLLPGNEISFFLKGFINQFPLNSLLVPGPLVSFFKNLSCFWPTATGQFGNVTPALPTTPGWSRARAYCLANASVTHLPNISIFLSRLRSVCNAATRPNVTEITFQNDTDGPRYLGRLYNQPCSHDENEIRNMLSPGAKFAYAGNLRLWQDAAAQLEFLGLPANLDSQATNVQDLWSDVIFLLTDTAWFGNLSATMTRYCQFWHASSTLEDCVPNNSAAGAVKCTARTNAIFANPTWNAQAGEHSSYQHGKANQVGHYSLVSTATLSFDATTSIHDIPEAHTLAAKTYHFNMVPLNRDVTDFMHGQFWNITPEAYWKNAITVYQGVLNSISRDYHSDSRISADHQ